MPFRPFTLDMADGRRVPVAGRDFATVSLIGHSVAVDRPDGSSNLLVVGFITGVTPAPNP